VCLLTEDRLEIVAKFEDLEKRSGLRAVAPAPSA